MTNIGLRVGMKVPSWVWLAVNAYIYFLKILSKLFTINETAQVSFLTDFAVRHTTLTVEDVAVQP